MEQEKIDQEERVEEEMPAWDDHTENAEAGTQPQKPDAAIAYEMEHDDDDSFNLSFASVLNGDILKSLLHKRLDFVGLLLVLTVLYITNRYSAEQELIEIADSKKELQDIKYRSLTRSSELTMRTRQSLIEAALYKAGDTTLTSSTVPPFVIMPYNEKD